MTTKQYKIQIIDFQGEYELDTAQLPLKVIQKSFSVSVVATIYFLSIMLLPIILHITDNFELSFLIKLFLSTSLIFAVTIIYFFSVTSLIITENNITFGKDICKIYFKRKWSEPIANYTAILGKRYYAKIFSDTPQLIREIILHHKSNPVKYNIILARYIEPIGSINSTQPFWADYWLFTCKLFNKTPINMVDKKHSTIDLAQIKYLEGDGGAVQL